MQPYYELLKRLAELFPRDDGWRPAANAIGVDLLRIDLKGSAIYVWTNILAAARTPRNLALLRDLVVTENPDLADVVTRYAADVEAGFLPAPDMPDVQAVELTENDLDRVAALHALGFDDTLPSILFGVALSKRKTSLKEIDDALAGQETKIAKARLGQFEITAANALKALCNQRSAIQLRHRALRNQIDKIERSSAPLRPAKPNTEGGTYEQQVLWGKLYMQDLQSYEAAIGAYRADREKLPGLRAEAEEVARDDSEITTRIAQQKLQNEVEAQGFEANLIAARDRDLLLKFNYTIGKASAAFHRDSDPFKGFRTLLGVTELASLFTGIAQPVVASEMNAALVREGEALAVPIERHLADIAKSALLGPAIIDRARKTNQATLDNLIAKLPVAQLVDGSERARRLVASPLLESPNYAGLQDPAEIDAKVRELVERRAALADHIARVKSEIESEPDAFAMR